LLAIDVPVSIAGPLRVGERDFRVPLATTDVALVAAIDRAARAITEAAGCRTTIIGDRHAGERVIELAAVGDARAVAAWAREEQAALDGAATAAAGRPARSLGFAVEGRRVRIRVDLDASELIGDAAPCAALDAICEQLATRGPGRPLAASRGEQPWHAALARTAATRGRVVAAEVEVPRPIAERWLGAAPRAIVRAHAALERRHVPRAALAALLVACGQELASDPGVAELGETADGKLHATLVAPSLWVGTAGGDSDRAPQRACLQMLGVASGGELAEVCAAACLAAALAEASAVAATTSADDELAWRDRLSPRLLEVLELLLTGLSERQIADRMGLSVSTTHQYVVQIYRAANVSSRALLMATLMRR
jgi:hydroxymethylglutaryl-CoA reductase (NADPH)